MLARADLRAAEEALRRWLAAAALARPGAEGGRVVVVGDHALAPVQALVRWDPAGAAERELAAREGISYTAARRRLLDGLQEQREKRPPVLVPIVGTPCAEGCDGSAHPGAVCRR